MDKKLKAFSDDEILSQLNEVNEQLDSNIRSIKRDYNDMQREINGDFSSMLAAGKLQIERQKLIESSISKKLEVTKLVAARLTSKEASPQGKVPEEAFDSMQMLDLLQKKKERGR